MVYKFNIKDVVVYKLTGERLVIISRMRDKMSNSYLCKDIESNVDVYSENDLMHNTHRRS